MVKFPGFGFVFAVLAGLLSAASAGLTTNPCSGQRDGAVFPSQTKDVISSCTSYVVCKGGTDTFVNCPKGQEFNSDSLQCQAPAAAGCKVGQISPKRILCRPLPVERLTTVAEGRRMLGLTTNPCAGQRDGAVFPTQTRDVITSCTNYVVCKNGADTFINCPKGQEFNPDASQCQAATAAGCKVGARSPKPINCV